MKGAAALTCIMSICWTSWAGQGRHKQQVCSSVRKSPRCPLRLKEKTRTKESRISNSWPTLVCPSGPLVPSAHVVLPISWLTQQGVFSACLSFVLLSGTGLSDEPALVCWKDADWQLGLTKLSQSSITDSHCLSDSEATKTVTAVCVLLVFLAVSAIKLPSFFIKVQLMVYFFLKYMYIYINRLFFPSKKKTVFLKHSASDLCQTWQTK